MTPIDLAQPPRLGEAITPRHPEYERACRTVFADGRPSTIIRPLDVEQVQAAICTAIGDGFELSVRSGGHSPAGLSTHDSGTVIDLKYLNQITVDPATRLVQIGAGATWGAVAAALKPHQLILSGGDTTGVGVGGLTLGGGIGWMVRQHGLTIDSLVGAQLVTADGAIHHVNAATEPDLFWAVRGGGGNVGVVTRLDFVAQQVATVHFGTISYPDTDVPRLLRGWRDAMRHADRRLTSTINLVPATGNNPATAQMMVCFADSDLAAADTAIEPFLELGNVHRCDLAQVPYADILTDTPHSGVRMSIRNILVPALTGNLIIAIDDLRNTQGVTLSLRSLGGAVTDVPCDATAYAHRHAEAMLVIACLGTETQPLVQVWPALASYGIGAYVNFLSTATTEDVRAAYPPATYRRLAAVKATYDPGNVFHRNHNVPPEHRSDDSDG